MCVCWAVNVTPDHVYMCSVDSGWFAEMLREAKVCGRERERCNLSLRSSKWTQERRRFVHWIGAKLLQVAQQKLVITFVRATNGTLTLRRCAHSILLAFSHFAAMQLMKLSKPLNPFVTSSTNTFTLAAVSFRNCDLSLPIFAAGTSDTRILPLQVFDTKL